VMIPLFRCACVRLSVRLERTSPSCVARIYGNTLHDTNVRYYAKKRREAHVDASKEFFEEMRDDRASLMLKLTDEENTLPVEQLTFEQLYRRILHMWEEGTKNPKKDWIFELVKKAYTDEEWGQMLIICRIFQHNMFLLNPHQASYFIMLACANGNQDKILKLFSEESPRLFCNKSGYTHLIKAFLDKNNFTSAWKVLDLVTKRNVPLNRLMFRLFIDAYVRESRLDDALRTIIVQRKMKLVIDPTALASLISALYKAEKYTEILSIRAMMKEDGASFLPLDLPYIIGAYAQSGDEAGALELIRSADKEALSGALRALKEVTQTVEEGKWLEKIEEKLYKAVQ